MTIETFTIRDLRERTGALTRDAESGHLSLVTKRGRPLFVAVPFTEEVLKEGIGFPLAMQLYQEGVLTTARAAALADMGLGEFMEALSELDIPVVDYSAEELAEEIAALE